MNKDYKKIIHSIALEEGLPDYVVSEILESPFSFMRQEIPKMLEIGDFKNFRIINLGIFYTNERILKELRNDDK